MHSCIMGVVGLSVGQCIMPCVVGIKPVVSRTVLGRPAREGESPVGENNRTT